MKPYIITILSVLLILMLSSGFHESGNEWKAPSEADALINPLKNSQKNINSAQTIFNKVCWTCHGIDGKGSGPASEPLVIKPANFQNESVQGQSDGAIFWKLSTGKGVMSNYSQTLTATQRWQLVLYIRALGNSADNNLIQQ